MFALLQFSGQWTSKKARSEWAAHCCIQGGYLNEWLLSLSAKPVYLLLFFPVWVFRHFMNWCVARCIISCECSFKLIHAFLKSLPFALSCPIYRLSCTKNKKSHFQFCGCITAHSTDFLLKDIDSFHAFLKFQIALTASATPWPTLQVCRAALSICWIKHHAWSLSKKIYYYGALRPLAYSVDPRRSNHNSWKHYSTSVVTWHRQSTDHHRRSRREYELLLTQHQFSMQHIGTQLIFWVSI